MKDSPWILRHCPVEHRETLFRVTPTLGRIGDSIFHLSGLLVFIFGPLLFAVWRPDAPIALPVIWLHRLLGTEIYMLTHVIISVVLWSILAQSIAVQKYKQKQEDSQQERAG